MRVKSLNPVFAPVIFILFFISLQLSCSQSNEPEIKDPNFKEYVAEDSEIDINSDGFPDLTRETSYYTYGGTTIQVYYLVPKNNAQVLCIKYNQPALLSKRDTILSQPPDPEFWRSQSINTMDCEYYNKNWHGWWAGKAGYIGLGIRMDSTYCLSWVNIYCDTLVENNILFKSSNYTAGPETAFVIQ